MAQGSAATLGIPENAPALFTSFDLIGPDFRRREMTRLSSKNAPQPTSESKDDAD